MEGLLVVLMLVGIFSAVLAPLAYLADHLSPWARRWRR
jgi:hypothetical protein